jgi:hypothetical protein
MSAEPELVVELDRPDWLPGETLTGRVRLGAALAASSGTLQLEVGWRTVSQGQADTGEVQAEEVPGESPAEKPFAAPLPAAPLSYEGKLLSIRWSVTARVSRLGGPAVTAEVPFRLGRAESQAIPTSPPSLT